MIAWFEGGHGDPWNHIEAAMALSAHGETAAAERAYDWLSANQRPDGAWHAYYGFDGAVEEHRLDTNMSAYVAVGIWQHFLATHDRGFIEHFWPLVERAIAFVISHQRATGEICWSLDPVAGDGKFALLTGCSSIYLSLTAALALATELGFEHRRFSMARDRLGFALRCRQSLFADKSEFAMDWYYPVLVGALEGEMARRRIASGLVTFVSHDGVRCRSDKDWITTAETAECAIALARIGRVSLAGELLASTSDKRRDDGGYLTGIVYPQGDEFPRGETTTYSAAAVLLAHDVLSRTAGASDVFRYSTLTRTRRLSQPAATSSTKRFEASASA